jgi:hypothetical protein
MHYNNQIKQPYVFYPKIKLKLNKYMFNYQEINNIPTVIQVKKIIDYMEKDPKVKYNFENTMDIKIIKPNKIILKLYNAHFGNTYEIFLKKNTIIKFKEISRFIH